MSDAVATVGVRLCATISSSWGHRSAWSCFIAPPGFPLESLGEVDRDRRVTNYAAKGTWQITSGRRFDASFFGDPAHGPNGPQRTNSLLRTTTSGFSALDQYGGHNQTVHYDDAFSSRFLIEASVSRALNRIVEIPSVNDWQVTDSTGVPNVISGGIGFYEAGNESNGWQYRAKGTTILSGGGQHQISYGFNYDRPSYDQINQRTGPTFTAPDGEQTATGAQIQILPDPTFGRIYRVTRANLNAARDTTQRYTAVFAEDSWQIGNWVTVRPGVRYEQETLSGTIIQGFKLKQNWAPRIGATWDPARNGRAKIYGNYGRYYARVPNDLAARALSADAAITADYFDALLTSPIPNGVLAGPAGSQTGRTSRCSAPAPTHRPAVKLSSSTSTWPRRVSVRAELTVGARYIHRNVGRVLEDAALPVVATDLGIPGAATADYT